MQRKLIPVFLSLALAANALLTGFTYATYPGIGDVFYEANREIAPDTIYTEQIAGHKTLGIEHAYTIEADLIDSVIKPIVFTGEINGKYTLSDMAKWTEQEGYKVVAGINGDLYDTSSGTSKGIAIHNGKIKTGGYYPEYAIAFKADGSAYLAQTSLSYKMNFKKYVTEITTTAITTSDSAVSVLTDTAIKVVTDSATSIDFFNVPHGAANGLHLFNRQFNDTTNTTADCVEVILTAPSTSEAELSLSGKVTAVVTEVRTTCFNSAIADNQLVLSAKSYSASAETLRNMVVGSTVEISVTENNGAGLSEAKEAIGVYSVIAQNGSVTTSDKTINPRTCIGIKSNGDIMLYIVDGRQSTYSKGISPYDVAAYMVSKGCVTVVNMDGGGSTTMIARTPGVNDSATLVNKPSEGTQRKTANGLLFGYIATATQTAANLHIYPSYGLVMPGATQQLSVYASNSLFEKTALPESVIYSVDKSYGAIDSNGLFTASNKTGEFTINAESKGILGQSKLKIVDDFTYQTSISTLQIEPQKTADINVINALYGYTYVLTADNLFTWECDENIGTIDKNGLFTAIKEGFGIKGNIYVKYNSQTVTIPVTVGNTISFDDVIGHWAESYILGLANKGIVKGITEKLYEPNSNLTRGQILTMLSKIKSGQDLSAFSDSGFSDVKSTDWFYSYVNWGVGLGIVKGMGDGTFAPNSNVTREQMTKMIVNYANKLGVNFTGQVNELSFSDNSKMSSWAIDAIKLVTNEGIMKGKTGNIFDPQGQATRAEAAKIVYQIEAMFQQQTANGTLGKSSNQENTTTDAAIETENTTEPDNGLPEGL